MYTLVKQFILGASTNVTAAVPSNTVCSTRPQFASASCSPQINRSMFSTASMSSATLCLSSTSSVVSEVNSLSPESSLEPPSPKKLKLDDLPTVSDVQGSLVVQTERAAPTGLPNAETNVNKTDSVNTGNSAQIPNFMTTADGKILQIHTPQIVQVIVVNSVSENSIVGKQGTGNSAAEQALRKLPAIAPMPTFMSLKNSLQNRSQENCRRRAHRCDQCGKEYYKSSHLKAHIRVHTGKSSIPVPNIERIFLFLVILM